MEKKKFLIKSEVWIYPSEHASWYFVSLSKKGSAEIKKSFGNLTRGWGSLPVSVRIGKSAWKTSIFYHKVEDVYILPIKSSIRSKERIDDGDKVNVEIIILV